MNRKATMKDIAAECGVSLSTVSLVMNKSPRISEKTRTKVMAAVERHDYQPNVHARGLVSRSSMVLSVVVPNLKHIFADIYFGEIVSGIYDAATENGYKMLLDIANQEFIARKEYLRLLTTHRADGMLFIASSIDDEYLLDFEARTYPFLLVNHYFPDRSLDYISIDYRACAEIASSHLLGLGHRSIGIIAGTNTYTGIDFRDTFIASCRGAGIPEDDLPWVSSEWNMDGGHEAARQLLERHPHLTAIMAGNDRMAIGAMRYLHTQGKSIPRDISVMGMDDILAASYTTPGLTTIRLDLYDVGQTACRRLTQIINNGRTSCGDLIPATLVNRESTGPAAG